MAKGRVTSEGLNMRLAPGSDEIVHTLAKGDEVHVIKSETHSKTWLFVWYRSESGDFCKYGWVLAEHVEIIPPKVSPYMPPVHHPKPDVESEPLVPRGVWFAASVVALAIFALAVLPALMK